jgi:hypothetical protein
MAIGWGASPGTSSPIQGLLPRNGASIGQPVWLSYDNCGRML